MEPTHSLTTSARQPRSQTFIPRFDDLGDIARDATTCFPAENASRTDRFLNSGIENWRESQGLLPVVQSVFTTGFQVASDRRACSRGDIIDVFIHRARELLHE